MKSKPNLKRKRRAQEEEEAEERGEVWFEKVGRVGVSQICMWVGFKRSNSRALETLTSVALRYIQSVGKCCSSIAASANRTDANVFDVAAAIRGLPSGNVAEMPPFPKPLPPPPVITTFNNIPIPIPIPIPSRACPHVPPWLPRIPIIPPERPPPHHLWGEFNLPFTTLHN